MKYGHGHFSNVNPLRKARVTLLLLWFGYKEYVTTRYPQRRMFV